MDFPSFVLKVNLIFIDWQVKQQDPIGFGLNRNKLYLDLLKDCEYKYREVINPKTSLTQALYICKYQNCNMKFTRAWNLLNHARMHQGMKPYACLLCPVSFTQKGNLK